MRQSVFPSVLGMALTLALLIPGPAAAQDYPQRPIRMIVGFPPGGTTDIVGRLLAGKLTERFGQQVVIDNRPGASGLIGGSIVVKSQPDGYTLFLSGASAAITVSLYAKPPYDVQKDLVPIAHIARTPYLLVVHPSLPVKNLGDFFTYAKARPGKISYGASATGTVHHLSGEMLKRLVGFDMTFIPYKGTGTMLPDLLGGRLQVSIDNVLALTPYVKIGALRALAVTTAKRTALLPDVPTIAESGVRGFDTSGWFGLYCAVKTPAAIVNKLGKELISIAQEQDTRDKLLALGADPVYGPASELREQLARDVANWAKVIKDIGLKVE